MFRLILTTLIRRNRVKVILLLFNKIITVLQTISQTPPSSNSVISSREIKTKQFFKIIFIRDLKQLLKNVDNLLDILKTGKTKCHTLMWLMEGYSLVREHLFLLFRISYYHSLLLFLFFSDLDLQTDRQTDRSSFWCTIICHLSWVPFRLCLGQDFGQDNSKSILSHQIERQLRQDDKPYVCIIKLK